MERWTKKRSRFVFAGVMLLAVACGGSGDGGNGDGDGDLGSGGSGDGDAAGGATGDGDTTGVDCSGSFGLGQVILTHDRIVSPAMTADELELFYVNGEIGAQNFVSTRRTSVAEPFVPGQPIAELDAVCSPGEDKTIDVSEDGLRVYVTCYLLELNTQSDHALFMVERPSLDEPFAAPTQVASFPSSASVTSDELSLIGSPYVGTSTIFATRTSLTESFGSGEPLPGLEAAGLYTPVLSPDGREIYGSQGVDIRVATRATASDPFEPVEDLVGVFPEDLVGVGSPEISADCRKLLFVGVTSESAYLLYQATR